MPIDIQTVIINGVFGLLVVVLSVGGSWWVANRRAPAQNAVDDSTAANTFRRMVLEQQVQIDELKSRLERAHLEVSLRVQVGEKPEILNWKWEAKLEETPQVN